MTSLRLLTYLIFAYTTVEGLVINVTYPNTLPFIFKDVAILLAYVALAIGSYGTSGSLRRISGPLTVFGVLTCAFLLLPSPMSLLGELVAIKQRLFYIPLAWVGYHFTRDESDLLGLLEVMAWAAIPASVFGIYLFFVGPTGLSSIGANYSAIIGSTAGVHGVAFWRVPGTFTSPGQYGMFLLANCSLFVAVLVARVADARQNILTLVSLVIAVGALLVSGSRTPLLLLGMNCVAFLALSGRLAGIGVWAGGLYGVLTLGYTYFGAGVQDRVGSIASFEHVERFKETYFGQLFIPMLMQSPMGLGLGRATIGSRHFTEWSNIILVESYFGIIAVETGILGFAAFSWVAIAVVNLIVSCRKIMSGAGNTVIWHACAVLVLSIIAVLPVGTPIDAAPGNLYFWFFVGVVIKLYRPRSNAAPVGLAVAERGLFRRLDLPA